MSSKAKKLKKGPGAAVRVVNNHAKLIDQLAEDLKNVKRNGDSPLTLYCTQDTKLIQVEFASARIVKQNAGGV